MKQECSRTAGRVEYALFDRALNGVTHDFRGKPVRRVVFTESMTLSAIDQRLVKDFQHVALDLIESEAPNMRENAPDEFFALRFGHYPVEKVALRRPEDAGRFERRAGEHTLRAIVTQAEYREGNRLRDNDKERVLKE